MHLVLSALMASLFCLSQVLNVFSSTQFHFNLCKNKRKMIQVKVNGGIVYVHWKRKFGARIYLVINNDTAKQMV